MIDVPAMVMEGFKLMGIGIGVVFVALGLFFIIMKLMLKMWPAKEDKEG